MSTVRPEHGLSAEEAARRLAREGPNTLPGDKRNIIGIAWETLKEPMFLLLIAAAVLYLTLGDLNEGLLLLFMVCVTVGVTLYQEGKTERTLEALRDLSSPRALVIRDGHETRIAGSELVIGDVLIVKEGDRIAADGVLVSASNLQVDESLLTGESWPVHKRSAGVSAEAMSPGGENLPCIWSGTLVVQGEGIAQITATGAKSEVGKIGSSLLNLSTEFSPLKKEITRLVKIFALSGAVLSIAVTIVYGISQKDWLQAILAGIALSMSLLPEEFPVIMTIFPAIGAWRMSKASVLTRRLSAIETLGSISILCTDKTGTLTENSMTVTHVVSREGAVQEINHAQLVNDTAIADLVKLSSLASNPQPFDPMEKAFHTLSKQLSPGISQHNVSKLVKEYPLTPELRAMSNVWTQELIGHCLVAAKGSPEAIAHLCRLNEIARQMLLKTVDEMAQQGLRVLAVACANCAKEALPSTQEEFQFNFVGLLGLTDPLREEIPQAMQQCKEAGIRVLMITGDHPVTATSIARQAGLPFTGTITGAEVEQLDDTQLRLRLQEINVCARITPDQKLRIVQALKAEGAVVAMTGDGVNDAPALKAAHVGIAMGRRGTDVAREAASLVLLDDNFASIVRGIQLGRRIYANMQNAMSYILSIHVPIAGMALLPVVFGWPILLFPMHIAFLELIIDPACSLAFENESSEEDVMRHPPRSPSTPLFNKVVLTQAFLQGFGAIMFVALAYALASKSFPEGEARTIGFSILVLVNIVLIFSSLSPQKSAFHVFRSKNRIPILVAVIAVCILLVVIYIPALADAFRFSPLSTFQIFACLLVVLVSLVWFEASKWLVYTRNRSLPS